MKPNEGSVPRNNESVFIYFLLANRSESRCNESWSGDWVTPPPRFLETADRDSRQGMYTTRQKTNRPYRNKNVRPLAGGTLGGMLLLSAPVLDLLRPISYITISGVLWNFFSSCVIFSDPFYPASSSCQRACFTVWQLSIYSVKCRYHQGLGRMWKAAVMA
jgi:hypothetical protein